MNIQKWMGCVLVLTAACGVFPAAGQTDSIERWRTPPWVPVPIRAIVHESGEVEVEYEFARSDQPATLALNRATIPVVSFDAQGRERPGVWFRVPVGPERTCVGAVERPWRLDYTFIAPGVWRWVMKTRIARLSHPVCEPGWELMVPGSDRLPLRLDGHPMARGGCFPGKVLEIVPLAGGNVPASALPAMARVESRINTLLSELTNEEACVRIEVRFTSLPDDPGLGDPPPGAPKALTVTNDSVWQYSGDSEWQYSGLNPNFRVHPALLFHHMNTNDFADGDQAYYDALPVSSVWARIGPQPPPPAQTLQIDTILVPAGLHSLWKNQLATALTEINDSTNWDYEPDDGVAANACDFEAVLTHEVFHVLGFTSNADWQDPNDPTPNPPYDRMTVMDLFRFDPADVGGVVSANEFTGQASRPRSILASASAIMPLYLSNPTPPNMRTLALSTGHRSVPPGDGRQASHWKDDVFGGPTLGIMDPTLPPGVGPFAPYSMSIHDIRALDRLGWNINTGAGVTVGDLLALAAPAMGTQPADLAVGVSVTPTFQWTRAPLLPDDLPNVSVFVYRADLGPLAEHLVWGARDVSGTSITMPPGILLGETDYAWTVVTYSPWSYNISGPYFFTTEFVCLADVNMDGNLDSADFTAWIVAFNAGDAPADQNQDGLLDSTDFTAWIANFNAGCP